MPRDLSKFDALSNAFAGVIAQAAKSPAQTGVTEKFARRLVGAGTNSLVLLDVSASMQESVGTVRKIDLLRNALAAVLPASPAALIAFNSAPVRINSLADLPSPAGSTALHLALNAAAASLPRHTLIVSDGQPDDEAAALAAADRLTGLIDVLYVGADGDAAAIAFMRRLARTGGGRVVVHDVTKQAQPRYLGAAIRGLLPALG
jgi:hypothetical protein